MAVINAAQKGRTVADPCAQYESISPLWLKSRAVCNGERFVKDYDGIIDTLTFSNLLIPFSPSMTQQQYNFYKAEAELPGVTAMHSKIIIGGLLRKQPQLELPENAPEDAKQWIMNEFAQDASPLVSFMDRALWEEMQTSRAWVYVDYPRVENKEELVTEDFRALRPYPVLWKAESVINWDVDTSSEDGTQKLRRVITRDYETEYEKDEFHPTYLDTVRVHEVVEGKYQIRVFQKKVDNAEVLVVNGVIQQRYNENTVNKDYMLVDTIDDIMSNGERLKEIPAWPLNGCIDLMEPILTPIIDKEIALYNKVSRRNHLLYGAATYTPWISSDMTDEQFDAIVGRGLGSWLKLNTGDKMEVLATPTDALADMDRSIVSGYEEIAKLGIRMLTPETSQSGVALDIRNAAQTAQLGTLNIKISNQLASIIAFMLNWRYGTTYKASDIKFELSADFNPTPLGADWLRLATEWYKEGLIPRSLWLQLLKINDMINPDYDDEEGQAEVLQDEIINNPTVDPAYATKVQQMAGADDDVIELRAAKTEALRVEQENELKQKSDNLNKAKTNK